MSLAVRLEPALPAPRTLRGVLRDLNALTKPRIIVLLELTTLASMVMAARGVPKLGSTVATLGGGWLAAAGANAINCWFDRDIDQAMTRTRLRPLPDGRIEPAVALVFGALLGVTAFALLTVAVNLLAATLAMTGLLFYVLVYTMWLKRSTSQNIVIGGAAGAIPPLVGWAAVTGRVDLTAILLFAIVFCWTPPHFWALSLLIRGDYARAGVPMLPVVAGARHTRSQIMVYSVILTLVTALPVLTGSFGMVYAGGAAALDAVLLGEAAWTVRSGSARSARRLYYYSLLYLALIFAVMALDRVVGG